MAQANTAVMEVLGWGIIQRVSTLVEILQKLTIMTPQQKPMRKDFMSLQFVRVGDHLEVREAEFEYVNDESGDEVKWGDDVDWSFREDQQYLFFPLDHLPHRVEHLLQIVRTSFVGRGFDELEITQLQNHLAVNIKTK